MNHNFDVEIATKYGLTEAILLNNLYFWIEKNRVNEVNFYDGYYWTYNSVKAFSELFPYLSGKQIRSAINKLIDKGLLITGNYNKSAYDRTLWYALTEKGLNVCRKEVFASDENGNSILPFGQMELNKRENQNAEKGKPIPDINTDNKTDIKKEGAKSPNPFSPLIMIQESNLPEGVQNKLCEFVEYRKEMHKPYKQIGLRNLINKTIKVLSASSERAVIDCISTSMAQGWQGIFYENIKPETKEQKAERERKEYAEQKRRVEEEFASGELEGLFDM